MKSLKTKKKWKLFYVLFAVLRNLTKKKKERRVVGSKAHSKQTSALENLLLLSRNSCLITQLFSTPRLSPSAETNKHQHSPKKNKVHKNKKKKKTMTTRELKLLPALIAIVVKGEITL